MTLFQRFSAALCAALCFTAVPASATNYSIDFTDLWFIPAESGWGFNVIQQGNTLFGTLFVYTNDRSARWYVASDMKPQAAGAGQAKFGGELYQTTGPFLGDVAFNPTQVAVTKVGDISITFLTSTTAVLVYNVGATTVTKNVVRQTFVNNSPVGVYIGAGMTTVLSACANSANNGGFNHFIGNMQSTLTGATATFSISSFEPTGQLVCNFSGTYAQEGRLGSVSGAWGCNNGSQVLNNGTFQITNLDVQLNGMTGNVVAVDQFCTYSGRFGGMRGLGTQ